MGTGRMAGYGFQHPQADRRIASYPASSAQRYGRHVDDNDYAVILGAGFSRAISHYMPLTDELGQAVIEAAGLSDDPRVPDAGFEPGFTFEEWLSLLADDQPQLSEAENRQNAALFARLKEALATVVGAAEAQAVNAGAPEWLYDLLSVLHYRRTSVITFNYDRLVEVGVATHQLVAVGCQEFAGPGDVLRDMPPLPPVGSRLWGPVKPTFRLLKLHGSIDWWSVPGDDAGATLSREELRSTFGDHRALSEPDRRQLLPGREPFIVPPAATKSPYYRNPMTRELWRAAAEVLQAAPRIAVVGYSLPPADLVMSGMIGTAIRGRDVKFEVVNKDPAGPRDRLVGLGANPDLVTEVGGDSSVADFTAIMCDRASTALVDQVRGLNPEGAAGVALLISWADPRAAQTATRRVSSIGPLDSDGTVELAVDQHPPAYGDATAARYDRAGTSSLGRFATLKDLVGGVGQARGLAVSTPDGGRVRLIASWYESRETGASTRWLALCPAGRQQWA